MGYLSFLKVGMSEVTAIAHKMLTQGKEARAYWSAVVEWLRLEQAPF